MGALESGRGGMKDLLNIFISHGNIMEFLHKNL